MQKFEVKFENFKRAITRLEEAVSALRSSPANTLYQDAVIQRFEFTFELCWKNAAGLYARAGNSRYKLTKVCIARGLFNEAD